MYVMYRRRECRGRGNRRREEVEERGRKRESHTERGRWRRAKEMEDLIKSVISCDRTSEAADVHPPLGRS